MRTTHGILKELRAAGWSQSAIARKTGIPQPRLSRWQSGQVPDGADDALRLAALLDEVSQLGQCAAVNPCGKGLPDSESSQASMLRE
ncbi:XRE family transcriptional regulator [Alcaligenes faecalis]|nr:XRE family transcriptional regulator [Alcaligenes faecalis]